MVDLPPKNKRIVISDEKHGLPYSKGLMASSIMATGLPPSRAYRVAKLVEDTLTARKRFSVNIHELRELTTSILSEHVGKEYADKYLRWQALHRLDKPLIVLIGGTTGVGKSTVATELAHRLGITRIVSTDALREVMRAVLAKDLMPALHDSSFMAWKALRTPLPAEVDKVVLGFREQTAAVAVGVRAVMDRAVREQLNMVIEGIHVVPGFVSSKHMREAFVVPLVITVTDAELHRSHFYIRELETEGFRPFEKYRANFEYIRKIGVYIEELAKEHNVSILESHSLDKTVSVALEEVINRVLKPETEASGQADRELRVFE